MNIVNIILVLIAVLLVGGVLGGVAYKRVPRRLKTDVFAARWKELQGFCRDKSTWPEALTLADSLLDDALKKRKYRGKTMGERMVSAQRVVTNNDAMWYAHNLCKKLAENPETKLKEIDVKTALLGFRSALKDIGALDAGKPAADTGEAKS